MEQSYVRKVQRWVELDNKIETKKVKLREYTDEKKELEESIVDYIRTNDKHNLQINTSDGYINFSEHKQQQMLTFKFLKESLTAFFESSPQKVDAQSIYDFIMKNRDVKVKTVMKRYVT